MIGKIDQYSFELPYRAFTASVDADIVFLDADQYSDATLIENIQKVAAESERVLFILSGDQHAELKKLLLMGEWLLKNKDKVYVLDLVENNLSSRWGRILIDRYCAAQDEKNQKQFIRIALQYQR